jgi:hypothetical protein
MKYTIRQKGMQGQFALGGYFFDGDVGNSRRFIL